ncbi:D(1) dopamine receptor-like [Saccoglossus kowalevskii]|uniref:Tyramine receptor 2-like n=1 Tax=Saccoglossus kowalevskii TaxID=10224 RepID=A0ABM0GKR7_SACKO|nr:PREDICTED: putative tyramine receptor 2-like [Saccoglossus kowalevskii]
MAMFYSRNRSNDSNGNLTDVVYYTEERDLVRVALIGVLLSITIVVTVIGNVFVFLIMMMYRHLRNATNLYMVSLAVADLLVGIFVMLPSMVDEIAGGWILGDIMCRLWIIMDVLCCTASIMNLCMISVDRYYIVSHPFRYAGEGSLRRVQIMMLIAWLVSIVVSVLPISFGWAFELPPMEVVHAKCIFVPNKIYAATASTISFYIPLLLMIFAYLKIFKIARIQAEKIQEFEREPVTFTSGRRKTLAKFSINFKRERKALRTLGIIMGCFLLCWLPFFITNVVNPFINYTVSPIAFTIMTWIGWVNSTVNPLLYSALNKEFRRAFRRILRCDRCDCTSQSRMKSTFVSLTELPNNTAAHSVTVTTPDKKKEFRFANGILEAHTSKAVRFDCHYSVITNFGKI